MLLTLLIAIPLWRTEIATSSLIRLQAEPVLVNCTEKWVSEGLRQIDTSGNMKNMCSKGEVADKSCDTEHCHEQECCDLTSAENLSTAASSPASSPRAAKSPSIDSEESKEVEAPSTQLA